MKPAHIFLTVLRKKHLECRNDPVVIHFIIKHIEESVDNLDLLT